jgi:hypothetical protein
MRPVADAPKPGTLRVEAGLYAALTHAAKGAGTSATALADQLLRDALELPGSGRRPLVRATAAGRKVTKQAPATCLHPIGRRIGTGCAACGQTVKA